MRRGFTMLEACIVVTIAGTCAAIAAPKFQTAAARSRLDSCVDRVSQDLESLRERARTLGVYQTVAFGSDGYKLIERTASAEAGRAVYLGEDPYRCTIGWVDNATELSYDAFGVPSTTMTIKLTNGVESYYLRIEPGTGAVSRTSRMDTESAAAVDSGATPVVIAADVDLVTPVVRVTGKVRYDATAAVPVAAAVSAVVADTGAAVAATTTAATTTTSTTTTTAAAAARTTSTSTTTTTSATSSSNSAKKSKV